MRLHHRLEGAADAPVVVFANSIGTTLELWDAQVPAFTRQFRVLRYDQLGHGRSDVPPGPYTVDQLGRELLSLLDELGLEQVSFCGLSLGGAVGMWLGASAPERLDRLVLAGTSAHFAPPERWVERAALVRAEGLKPIADATMGRWFTPAFADVPPYRAQLVATPSEGYAACCDALAVWDFRASLATIPVPTLVLVGSDDPATTPEQARLIADGVPDAELVVLPHAAHLLNVEQPDAFNEAALAHLTGEEARWTTPTIAG
jgi:3-oxoadipate enol-lactonase